MWHLTCDTWHVTHETGCVIHYTQGVVNIVLKFQVNSFSGLGVMMFWTSGGKGYVTDWLTEFINDSDVKKISPAKDILNVFCLLAYQIYLKS